MKLKEVINYESILKSIIDNEPNVSPVIKFKFLGMIKQFSPCLENLESIRSDLVKKYGEENEEGGYTVLKDTENYKLFSEDMLKLLDQEIETNISKFKAEDIMNAGIPADAWVLLYDLIEE